MKSCFFLICCLAASSLAFDFDDCGSAHGSIESVKVSDCDPTSMEFCPFKKGNNVSIELNFKTSEELTQVHVDVHGIIAGVPMPFILPNSDGCTDSGLTCPMAAGSVGKYELSLPIKKAYPRLKVRVKLELQDQNKEDIICVLIPAKIV